MCIIVCVGEKGNGKGCMCVRGEGSGSGRGKLVFFSFYTHGK